MFFAPAVVTARSISLQVNMAANQLVTNFQTAVNPQIVKRYAAGNLSGSKELLLQTARFSYFLMLLIGLPILLTAEPLLKLWLGIVPQYTVIFLQIIVFQSLVQVFDTTFYMALYAKGRLKENALLSPTIGFLCFPIVYILFKMGYSPVVLSWAYLIDYALLAFVVKPLLIVKIADYKWNEIIPVFWTCLKVTLVSLPFPVFLYFFTQGRLAEVEFFFVMVIVSVLSVGISVWYCGLNSELRTKLIDVIKNKIHRK
jgi:Na+-driven multidrug efflux pump